MIIGRGLFMITHEKKELIYQSYEKTLDLDLAYKKLGISKEEQDILQNDISFQERLAYAEASKKEVLLENLFNLANNAKTDNVRLNALLEIMKTYYPERFGNKKEQLEDKEQIVIYLPENERGN
jgi:hypothetical protein